MKLYEFTGAPNPRRVRIFLAEKGIKVPYEQIDIGKGQNRSPEFLKLNPMGGLPVLELDDGTELAESVAICRYFEGIQPEPRLMGIDAKDIALVEMWNRRMEFEILSMTAGAFRNTNAFFKGRIPQVPEYGEICKNAALKRLEWLDTELANRPYIAGDRFTIADITAMVGIDFGRPTNIRIQPEQQKNLARWHASVSSRPSAKA
jgi:glutathione S-transferase